MSQQLPTTNKAYVYEKTGNPEDVLFLRDDLPIPPLSSSQVLVEVKASGFNPISYKAMTLFPSFLGKKPCVPENDVSGVVVGSGSSAEFKPGDEVLGMVPAKTMIKKGFGTLGKYAIVECSEIVKKPSNLSWEQAACLPLTGMTAMQALKMAGVQKGHRVFINGASGGVGVMGVQIAKDMVGQEGYVAASCSAANEQLVLSIGADDVLDYRKADLATQLAEKYPVEQGKGFDVLFDTIYVQNLYEKSPSYLKPSGTYVTVGGGSTDGGFLGLMKIGGNMFMNMMLPTFFGGTPRKFTFVSMKPTKEALLNITHLAEQGKIKPIIDSSHDFGAVLDAYKRIMSGRAVGKVILRSEN